MATFPTFRVQNAQPGRTASFEDEADSSATTPGAGSNWLWVAEIANWNVTLEVDFEGARLAGDLQRHFAEVKFHALERGVELPFPAGVFDCVTLNGVLERLIVRPRVAPKALLEHLFAECRRVLAPGGCLYVGTGPITTGRAPSRWRSLVGPEWPIVADRLLRGAGFKAVHSYCVDPCLDKPYVMVPATRRSLIARERALAACGASGFRRMVAVRLGLAHTLYPARIGLAYT